MQISKPWNSHAGLAPEANNIPNEIQGFELRLDLKFALFIRRTDYWNDYWNQICNNKRINPLVRGTLDLFWLQHANTKLSIQILAIIIIFITVCLYF